MCNRRHAFRSKTSLVHCSFSSQYNWFSFEHCISHDKAHFWSNVITWNSVLNCFWAICEPWSQVVQKNSQLNFRWSHLIKNEFHHVNFIIKGIIVYLGLTLWLVVKSILSYVEKKSLWCSSTLSFAIAIVCILWMIN